MGYRTSPSIYIRKKLKRIGNFFKKTLKRTGSFFVKMLSGIGSFFKRVFMGIVRLFKLVFIGIGRLFAGLFRLIKRTLPIFKKLFAAKGFRYAALSLVLAALFAGLSWAVHDIDEYTPQIELTLFAVPEPAAETMPASAPTPQPTPEPTPQPTEAPLPTKTPRPIPDLGGEYYNAFFDGGVFVGDSITQGLQNYVMRARAADPTLLGDARFAAVKSFSLKKASSNKSYGITPKYRGKKYNVPDVLKVMGAEKVFIMLGVNDWAGCQIENCINQYTDLIDNIFEINPDIKIYVQSCTPVSKARERTKLNNDNLDEFNVALKALCLDKDVYYIDISTALKDENNALKRSYTSDNYVHMSAEGASVWVGALYQYAYDEHVAGRWFPPPDLYWSPELSLD